MNKNEYLSATTLSKKTSSTLDSLENGDTERYIILKNNAPKAVMLSIEAFEAMEEEIEDLRLTSLALSRLQSFDKEKTISHETMMNKFAK